MFIKTDTMNFYTSAMNENETFEEQQQRENFKMNIQNLSQSYFTNYNHKYNRVKDIISGKKLDFDKSNIDNKDIPIGKFYECGLYNNLYGNATLIKRKNIE